LEIQLSRGEGWNPTNRLRFATFLAYSKQGSVTYLLYTYYANCKSDHLCVLINVCSHKIVNKLHNNKLGLRVNISSSWSPITTRPGFLTPYIMVFLCVQWLEVKCCGSFCLNY